MSSIRRLSDTILKNMEVYGTRDAEADLIEILIIWLKGGQKRRKKLVQEIDSVIQLIK